VRATLVTLTALPLSLAVALLVLWAWGLSINVMTLGGLAVAIGELVDDAIIDVENVLRRLRENAALPEADRKAAVDVIFSASNEIRSSVVFATVIICMVFVPLLFLAGLEGRFFQPLGIAYIVSILASLVVALSVTPALCRFAFARVYGRAAQGDAAHRDSPLARFLKARYEPLLRRAVAHRGAGPRRRRRACGRVARPRVDLRQPRFFPSFREGTFTVFLMAPPGTSLAESDRLALGVEAQLVEARRRVRALRAARGAPSATSTPSPSAVPRSRSPSDPATATRTRSAQASTASSRTFPGITTMVGQPIEHRMSHILSGTPAAIAINVFGNGSRDPAPGLAKEIEAALKTIPGTRDVNAEPRGARHLACRSATARRTSARRASLPAAAAQAGAAGALRRDGRGSERRPAAHASSCVRLAEDERERIEQVGDLHAARRAAARPCACARSRTSGPSARATLSPARTRSAEGDRLDECRRRATTSAQLVEGRAREGRPDRPRRGLHRSTTAASSRRSSRRAARSSSMGAVVAVVMFLLLQLATGRAARRCS
jgi:Cu/Ag efflux pump CusA